VTEFGGLGGAPGGRPRDESDLFETALDRTCGDRMRADHCVCPYFSAKCAAAQVWGALANVDWKHDNGDTASYSFRAAGDMIAAILAEGDYVDWYCSAPYGFGPDWMADAMAKEGWRPDTAEEGML
jgi:hypothetical protein